MMDKLALLSSVEKELEKYITETIPNEEGCIYRVTVPRAARGWTSDTPIRMRVSIGEEYWKPLVSDDVYLAKWEQMPETYGWVIPQ